MTEDDIDLNLISSSEDEDSIPDEEEDENADQINDELTKTFLKTYSCLKSKNPSIYNPQVAFFSDPPPEPATEQSGKEARKENPVFLRDYERDVIVKKGGRFSDDEENEDGNQNQNSKSYVQEQKEIKESFKRLMNDYDDEEDEDFLKIKTKNQEEKANEESNYIQWLKGQKNELDDKETEEDLKYLHDYWLDPNLDEKEKFLRDYILNKRYLEPLGDATETSKEADLLELQDLEEAGEYERRYDHRHEEPDSLGPKTYPRDITSVRRTDDSRKLKRQEREKRKAEQLEAKRLEVKKKKKLKKQQIMEQIEYMKKCTGNKELPFDIKKEVKEGEFTDEKHDALMKAIFNDEFYGNDDDDCDDKPVFSDLDLDDYDYEEEGGYDMDGEYHDEENDGTEYDNPHNFEENHDADYEVENYNDNDEIIMDCDYDPELERESKLKRQKTRSAKRKGHKKSTFAEAVQRKKPVFDPSDMSYQQYVDEYYGLDFEDMIGDMPCRYKYRKTEPNDFGLSVEEILLADDKELNRWCSMQKVDTLRPIYNEKHDKKVYSKRAHDINLKKKFLPSLFKEEEEDESKANQSATSGNSKQQDSELQTHGKISSEKPNAKKNVDEEKKISSHSKSKNVQQTESKNDIVSHEEINSGTPNQNNSNKDRKRKKRKSDQNNEQQCSNNKRLKTEEDDTIEGEQKSNNVLVKTERHATDQQKFDSTNNVKKGGNSGAFKKSFQNNKGDGGNNRNHANKGNKKNSDNHQNKNNNFKKPWNKNNNFNNKRKSDDGNDMTDERLRAFGLNPKKHRNFMKYGTKNNNKK